MSWNNNISAPNWAGIRTATANPNTNSNVINVSTINANTISSAVVYISSIYTNFISSGTASISSINNSSIASFSASNWYQYPAQGDVNAALLPLPPIIIPPAPYRRIYDLNNFRDINCGNVNAQFDGLAPLTTGKVSGFRSEFARADIQEIVVDNENEVGTVSIYAANKVAGLNGLFVEGGTTLTGGGIIHGVTIGAFRDPLTGFEDLVRIDVLPTGMDLLSYTYITIDAAGAANVAAGGALSLDGGSYIEYVSDQHYFRNTTSGNDFTDIFVGNIHAADGGSAPLRINDAARGVQIDTTKQITMYSTIPPLWSDATTYNLNNKVIYGSSRYNSKVTNLNLPPGVNIPLWYSGSNYVSNNYSFVTGVGAYRCISNIAGGTISPNGDGDHWTFFSSSNNAIQIWETDATVDFTSYISGDYKSYITMGTGNFTTLNVSTLNVASSITVSNIISKSISTDYISSLTSNGLVISNVNALYLTPTVQLTYPEYDPNTNYAVAQKTTYESVVYTSITTPNQGNIPNLASIEPWVAFTTYIPGNIRYYSEDDKSYRCTNSVDGDLAPPDDVGNWEFFQNGAYQEDVWYAFTEPVAKPSFIQGNLLSYVSTGTSRASNAVYETSYISTLTANFITTRGADNGFAVYFPDDESQPAGVFAANDGIVALAGVNDIAFQALRDLYGFGGRNMLLEAAAGTGTIRATGGNLILQAPTNDIVGTATSNISFTAANDITINSTAGDTFLRGVTTRVYSDTELDIETGNGDINIYANVTPSNNIRLYPGGTGSIICGGIISGNPNISLDTGGSAGSIYLGTNNGINMISGGNSIFQVANGNLQLTTNAVPGTTIGNIAITSSSNLTLSAVREVSISGTNINIGSSNAIINSISSLRLSTGTLFAGQISSLQLGVSSINANRANINFLTGAGSATTTDNIYPRSGSAQIGFYGGGGTASGGFYNNISVRSTFTQVIAPDIQGIYSNIVRIQGNTLMQNINVSSIFTSTLSTNVCIASTITTRGITLANSAGTAMTIRTNTTDNNVNIAATSNVNLTGNIFFTTADLQLYNSRFGIPDTANFAWFRYTGGAFSQSLDTGGTWTPVAGEAQKYPRGYGDYFSVTTQPIGTANTAWDIPLGGYTVQQDMTYYLQYVTVTYAGWYNITFGGNVENTGGADANVVLWLVKAGTAVPYSAIYAVATNSGHEVAMSKTMMVYLNGTTNELQMNWAADRTNVQLITFAAITSPYTAPAAASAFINLQLIKQG